MSEESRESFVNESTGWINEWMNKCRTGRGGTSTGANCPQDQIWPGILYLHWTTEGLWPEWHYKWVTVSLPAQDVGHDIKYSRDTWPSFLGAGGVGFSVSSEHPQAYIGQVRGQQGNETKGAESFTLWSCFRSNRPFLHSPSWLCSGKFHVSPPCHHPRVQGQTVSLWASHASCQG